MEELYPDNLAVIDVVLAICTERKNGTPVDKRLTHLAEFNGILAKDNVFAC